MSASRMFYRRPKREKAPKETGFWWNYEPCEAAVVQVIVGPSERPTWWCAGLEGKVREAVRITYGGQVFYIDNEDGAGMKKVKSGGGPDQPHRSLPVARELVFGCNVESVEIDPDPIECLPVHPYEDLIRNLKALRGEL